MGIPKKHEGQAALSRLETLGLEEQDIRDAVIYAESQRSQCTENDPATFPGLVGWGRTIRGLRDILIPKGWKRGREGGLPTVIDPTGLIAITVTTGDEATGFEDKDPKSKYRKGPSIRQVINRNNQLNLFPEMFDRVEDVEDGNPLETWILLVSFEDSTIRCELSKPASLDEKHRIVSWAERVIFDPIELEEVKFEDSDNPEPIEVNVTRKAE